MNCSITDSINISYLFVCFPMFNLKLNKPRVNKSIRLNSFAMRNIPVWNNLPSEAVNSKTVLEFKTKLDKIWRNTRYDLSEVY